MKKTITLKVLFTQFIIMLILFLLIAVAIPVLFLLGGVNFGLFTPANMSEVTLQKAQAEIATSKTFTEDSIPRGIEYVLLDKSLSLIQTDMSSNDVKKALFFAKGEYDNSVFSERFALITRDNEYVVLKYFIKSSYAYKELNEFLPSPELLCYILIGFNMILVCIITSLIFAKKVKRQILPLYDAAGQIGNQNLDFDIGHSNIRELNDVLISFDKMKGALQISLEKQWKDEQEQREQIAALAHDLKTPLTVLYGNLDLLHETKLTTEQDKYIVGLLENVGYMEQSIKTLIELSQTTSGYSLQISVIDTATFLETLQHKVISLSDLKDIQTEFSFHHLPAVLQCDYGLLERAILNVISNAVDFTPKHGTICCEAKQEGSYFIFTVADSGKGFSKEALEQGTNRFYMGDPSRSSRHHYGMGLMIAEKIIGQHSGKLILDNATDDLHGAQVTLLIPI
ncbi:HAMP domain-containing histidine kinase [Lachnospiraceae bacterium ZAX-1]